MVIAKVSLIVCSRRLRQFRIGDRSTTVHITGQEDINNKSTRGRSLPVDQDFIFPGIQRRQNQRIGSLVIILSKIQWNDSVRIRVEDLNCRRIKRGAGGRSDFKPECGRASRPDIQEQFR